MAKKKKKKKGRKKKTHRKSILFSLTLSLGCIFLLSLYFYFSNSSNKFPSFVYEEIFSSKTELSEGIKDADYAIYQSLFKSGLKEKDVLFLDVQPRHRDGYVWDFAELLVACPDPKSILGLYVVITRNLSALGRDIVVRDERLPDGRICCHVFVGDFYTHKISLQFDRPKPSSKDARPRIAIIIDDLGYDRNIAFSFIHMDLGLSFSILPSAPFTELIVREVNRQRSEVILHLPMETKDYPSVDPGPGALLLSMDENKIKSVLDRNLRWIRGAKGVNNHMGSAFTENREKMLVLLRELKKRGLFFIDSRTSSGTVGLELARKIGLPAAERRIFIDNNLAYKAMKIQMDRLLSAARHSGAAIAIGHPHKETLRILEEYRSKIMTEFQVVPVSDLVS